MKITTLEELLDKNLGVIGTEKRDKFEKNVLEEAKKHNDKIMALIAEKQENSLKGKSIEELKALLK